MNLLKRLMPKDSFYLILFACIGVVGASAIWVSKGNMNVAEKSETKSQAKQEQLKMIEEEIKLDLKREELERKPKLKKEVKPVEETKVNTKKEPVKEQATQEAKKEPQAEVKPEEQSQSTEQAESVESKSVEVSNVKLKKPVQGKISKDFAIDKLVYNKTLDEWSTHLGIDIVAKEGTNVVAALDGTVKQVINDKQLGITIIIDHGNDLETVYKNIGAEDLVKTGQKVKTGHTISKVSKGIGFEKLDDPHLHFEVKKSGKYVDPKNFF